MKLVLARIVNLLICIFIMSLWGCRYLDWGINGTLVMSFMLISGTALFILFNAFTTCDSQRLLNPYTLLCMFIFFWGYSFIPLSETNEQIDFYAFILLLLSVFFFLIGIFIGEKMNIRCLPLSSSISWRILIFRITVFLSVLIFLLECLRIGFVPIFVVLQMDVYSIMNEKAIPILHYFVQLVYILPVWALLLYRIKLISIRERNLVIAICIFVIFNYFSRQMWLWTIICVGIYYIAYHRFTKKKLLLFASIPIILFLFLGAIRLATIVKDDRNNLEYLKDFSQINYEVNLMEVYMGLYSSANFTTFKKFVHESDKQKYKGYGVYTLRPVYTILGLNLLDSFDINKDFDSFSALGTYAIEPYLDFGLMGVIVINLIYGIFVGYSYNQYEKGRIRWIIPWSMMAFCLIMSSFTNYYNAFFVWFVVALNFFILPPFCKYDKYSIPE